MHNKYSVQDNNLFNCRREDVIQPVPGAFEALHNARQKEKKCNPGNFNKAWRFRLASQTSLVHWNASAPSVATGSPPYI